MSPQPGVEVTSRAGRSYRGDPTDTGVGFMVDFSEWGPSDAALKVQSLDDFIAAFGARVSYSLAYDAAELFFAEGGAELYVARQVGPAPVKATRTLVDRAGAPLSTLRIDSLYYGDRGNRIKVAVANGVPANTFTITVLFDDVLVETFADLANPAAAVAALATSGYVRAVDLASATVAPNNNPAVLAATALAGGTDDHASAVAAQFTAALNLFVSDLGPGQVFAPGRTDVTSQTALIDHARTHNRSALLDAADSASKATLLAARNAVKNLVGAEYAELAATWVNIPAYVAGGSVRAVPGSAHHAGLIARVDALEGTAGAAAAGEVSASNYALDVRYPAGGFTDQDLSDLNDAGVNITRNFLNRGILVYGFRSVTTNADWLQFTAQRLRMSLTAKLRKAWDRIPFQRIDGRKILFGRANGMLRGVCRDEWEANALYGETVDDAFVVDTGDTINTPVTIAAGQVKAQVRARFSPFAERASIDLVKEPVTSDV